MRLHTVFKNLSACLSLALPFASLLLSGQAAQAQFPFTSSDWLMHRGTPTRQGGNQDIGLTGSQLVRTWVWPPTADMPAEIVADNTTLPAVIFPSKGVGVVTNWDDPARTVPPTGAPIDRLFGVTGAGWTYPAITERTGGAWPPNDVTVDKPGDYVYANAVQDPSLASIGVSTLSHLPDLGDTFDPVAASNLYKTINTALVNDPTVARWTFGDHYPDGTYQGGKRIVDTAIAKTQVLAPNQRYAVYLRFPNSGTLVGPGQIPHPNVDHVMVRVSWGDVINDPVTSRIFMLNFGETGGTWKRVRTGAGDDRYFPYDGTHPITVTLYTVTPDDPNDTTLFGASAIVPADAVRLVPEALRGDIHASASSAKFPLTVAGNNRNIQLTYFGRDETTGPIYIKDITLAKNYPTTGFPEIPWNPTLPPQTDPLKANYNPLIADPSSSVRSAVFYCIGDDLTVGSEKYGRLIWRYEAKTNPVRTVTVDDSDGLPFFTPSAGFVDNPIVNTGQPYGTNYKTASVSGVDTAVWEQGLPDTAPGGTWSVYVWIPGGDLVPTPQDFAHFAHYTITTDQGPIDVTLDQRNVAAGVPRVGTWRRLASGIRFPSGVVNAVNYSAVGHVSLASNSPEDIAEPGGAARLVAADALQFVSESRTSNSVVAAPCLANVTFPGGHLGTSTNVRQVVYFATTDGHVWALDALGPLAYSTAPANQGTNTTAYWVYPSISNPTLSTMANPQGLLSGPQDDPNNLPDPLNNVVGQGIDADIETTTVNGATIYNAIHKAPDLGAFVSSPVFVRVQTALIPPTYQEYLVIGNQNGRIYALDPAGRVSGVDPFPATIAQGDVRGAPGTTRRLMTWPSTARDKWLRKGGYAQGKDSFAKFTDDPGKGIFQASPTAEVVAGDDLYQSSKVIAGAGDGHVYAVNMAFPSLKPNERISNSTVANAATDGIPVWQYPNDTTQLDPITQPGALSTDFSRFTFTAGGRVYTIKNPPTVTGGVPVAEWIYPYTSAPPANPNANDLPRLDTEFTAPALRVVSGFNGGNEAVFIANRDGTIYSFDNTVTGNVANLPLWTSLSQGTTRASVTYIDHLERQAFFNTQAVDNHALLLPLDSGGMISVNVAGVPTGGKLIWELFDSILGGVPLVDTEGFLYPSFTSVGWRGGDAITANQWVFSGDEGNQDTGEVNGQMRAYGSSNINGGNPVTGDEPDIEPAVGQLELRLVDLFNSTRDQVGPPYEVYESFGDTNPMTYKSPYDEELAGHQRRPTVGNVAIYEWGDTIYAVAWGIEKTPGTPLPQVTFTLSSGTTNRQVPAQVFADLAYQAPPNPVLTVWDGVMESPARAWVAKAAIPLGRGSDEDPQTPGRQYRVSAFAQVNTTSGAFIRTPILQAGQFDQLVANGAPPPTLRPPQDPNVLIPPRIIAIAHPFALTTRGVSTAGAPNTTGWTDNIPVDNSSTPLTELMANGNTIMQYDMATGTFIPIPTNPGAGQFPIKDLIAPLGFISHGSSGAYSAVDNTGKVGPALLVADRSNLYKIGQSLNGIRVERREMRWGWDIAGSSLNALQKATGNVMNPLPWENFPITLPNVSTDYPDIDRTRANFRQGDQNLSLKPITLPRPNIVPGSPSVKVLNPVSLDLTVDVPKYQPANINHYYYDVNGVRNPSLLSPMNVSTGAPVNPATASLRGLIAPSGGYVGSYAIYFDSNGDGVFQGFAPLVSQGQRVTPQAREEVFRQMNVSFSVPPDVNIRTEEETIDLGKVPHGMGYAPGAANTFEPSFMGQHNGGNPFGTQSVWDSSRFLQFFQPFTVRNEGNVNLWNVRTAKIIADYSTDPRNPAFWTRLVSDQVETGYTFNNPPLYGVPFRPFTGVGGTGVTGIVSSLDHSNGSAFPAWDNLLWPYAIPAALPQDYVLAGNVLGWAPYTRPQPTLHKPLPGDPSGTTLSIPDVAHGDPISQLSALPALDTTNGDIPRSTRPKISMAIPLGTPIGTYSAPIYTYEDHTPEQWRQWIYYYRDSSNATSIDNTPTPFGDNDGLLNSVLTNVTPLAQVPFILPEARSNPTFTLKATVTEARLTNGTTPGTFIEIDNRGSFPSFGANIQPTALFSRGTQNILLAWPSNRVWNGTRWQDPGTTDSPWYLTISALNPIINTPAGYNTLFFDWRYENLLGQTQWWNPVTPNQQYPTTLPTQNLFPSNTSQIPGGANPNTPVVPGIPVASSVRHGTPALAQDDDPNNPDAQPYLFWQGAVNKSGGTGGLGATTDIRTFYTPVDPATGLPPDPASTPPYSFLNDPSLPKFAPKPVILTDRTGQKMNFLFWYGGPQGRSRLYYNHNGNLSNVVGWSADTALPTPGALESHSMPTPIHRLVYTTWFNPAGELLDVIDVVYTGVLVRRRQPETLLTRYALEYPRDPATKAINGPPTGRLIVMPIGVTDATPGGQTDTDRTVWHPVVRREVLSREGASQTYAGRGLAWLYQAQRFDTASGQFRRDYIHTDVDMTVAANQTQPYIKVYVYDRNGVSRNTNGGEDIPVNLVTGANVPPPTYDSANGRLYFASSLGGQVIIDTQGGAVTFNGGAPAQSDRVVVAYTPQTLRLNVNVNESNAVVPPAGNDLQTGIPWANDPGFALKPHVAAPGANSSPAAFIDRSLNPRFTAGNDNTVFPGSVPASPISISRMYLFYRKADSNAAAGGALYYKTMRLMVRLPRGVLRNLDGTINGAQGNNIVVTGNIGPYEVDWIRGRVYFTEVDEGREVGITFNYGRQDTGMGGTTVFSVPQTAYRVMWGDEISTATAPGDATTSETILPTQSTVNEGQISAFKPSRISNTGKNSLIQDRVWVFWSSTRAGTTDLYYMTLSPQFYTQPGF